MDGPFGVPNFVGPEGKGGVLPSPPVPPSKWWEGAAAHLFTFYMYLHVKRKKRGVRRPEAGGRRPEAGGRRLCFKKKKVEKGVVM